MNNYIKRESSFELIRIIAQFMIVLYHILSVAIFPTTQDSFYKALWLPLHIGVPLFILISGYFGIKASIKGLIKLIGIIFILQVPLLIINYYIHGENLKEIIKISFFISNTPFGFMRTYLFLYLFSPVINLYLKNITIRHRITLLIILFYISHYIGTLQTDPSLIDGKNLITFLFLYAIGDSLKHYRKYWNAIPKMLLLVCYMSLNIILVLWATYFNNMPHFNGIFNRIFFAYCSPILLVNSIMFFILIGQIKVQSNFINRIAKSSLPIYLIHGSPIIIYDIISPLLINIYNYINNPVLFILAIILFTLLIMLSCITIDNLLNPIWKILNIIGMNVQEKYNILCSKID